MKEGCGGPSYKHSNQSFSLGLLRVQLCTSIVTVMACIFDIHIAYEAYT